MTNKVAEKIGRIKNGIAEGTDVMKDLLELALTAFPDSYHDEGDALENASWGWCWDELGSDAQDYVQEVRSLIELYLKWKKDI